MDNISFNGHMGIEALASSEEAKRLIEGLNSGGGQSLKDVAEAISSGDAEKAKRLLKPMLDSPDIAGLVRELVKKTEEE